MVATPSGFGRALDPGGAPTTVYSSNYLPDAFDADVTLDGAAVAGLGGVDQRAPNAHVTIGASATKDAPVEVRLTLGLWAVKIVAHVSIDGALAAYRAPATDGSTIAVARVPIAAAAGETASLVLLAGNAALAGDARLDGGSPETPIAIDGPGTYYAEATGLVKAKGSSSGSGTSPAFLACWVANDGGGSALSCRTDPSSAAPEPTMIDVDVDGADGAHRHVLVLLDPSEASAQILSDQGDATEAKSDGDMSFLALPDASFPAKIALTSRLGGAAGLKVGHDGEITGFGDAFADTPVVTTFDVAAPDALPPDAPFVARMPIGVWKVAVTGDGPWVGTMDDYTATVQTAWGEHAAGSAIDVKGALLAALDGDQVKAQTLYLLVDEGTTELTGKTLSGAAFAIRGSGRYVADAEGLHAAP
jgi:hypothetical protein